VVPTEAPPVLGSGSIVGGTAMAGAGGGGTCGAETAELGSFLVEALGFEGTLAGSGPWLSVLGRGVGVSAG
jgi:hypothetical protein